MQRQMAAVTASTDLTTCPSFNSYTSQTFAQTAARVAAEEWPSASAGGDLETVLEEDSGDDGEFEFSVVPYGGGSEDLAFTVSADDIFDRGQIRPMFPVFNQRSEPEGHHGSESSIRVPLKSLFFEDPHPASAAEAEAAGKESFCVWTPKLPSPESCKKSRSTGSSSRRWKFIDLLRRSNSTDGEDSFVFLTPVVDSGKKKHDGVGAKAKRVSSVEIGVVGKGKGGSDKFASAHEIFYIKNRALKEGEKRRSYLPYRQDLVGFFAKVNGLGKINYPPV